MRLLPLSMQTIKVIDKIGPTTHFSSPGAIPPLDEDGQLVQLAAGTMHFEILESHTEHRRRWLHVSVKFEPRDLWFGVFVDAEGARVFVCLIPTLPLIFEVKL